MKPKSIFKSRTALLALLTALTGALGTFADPVKEFISHNAEAILIGVGAANFFFRRLTKDQVTILPADDQL